MKIDTYFKFEEKESSIPFDDILKARDELFEKRLADGLKAHRKLLEMLPK